MPPCRGWSKLVIRPKTSLSVLLMSCPLEFFSFSQTFDTIFPGIYFVDTIETNIIILASDDTSRIRFYRIDLSHELFHLW